MHAPQPHPFIAPFQRNWVKAMDNGVDRVEDWMRRMCSGENTVEEKRIMKKLGRKGGDWKRCVVKCLQERIDKSTEFWSSVSRVYLECNNYWEYTSRCNNDENFSTLEDLDSQSFPAFNQFVVEQCNTDDTWKFWGQFIVKDCFAYTAVYICTYPLEEVVGNWE